VRIISPFNIEFAQICCTHAPNLNAFSSRTGKSILGMRIENVTIRRRAKLTK